MKVIAIDPGIAGAVVVTDGTEFFESHAMPVKTQGRDRSIDFGGVYELLRRLRLEHGPIHVFLERAIPMAMGSKGAFSYGRGFEALVIAIELHRLPCTLLEPSNWTRAMHEGISSALKPKARSLIAVQRLFPTLICKLPQKSKGGYHDGPIDALLMAGYGLRQLNAAIPVKPAKSRKTVKTGPPAIPAPVDDDDIGDFF